MQTIAIHGRSVRRIHLVGGERYRVSGLARLAKAHGLEVTASSIHGGIARGELQAMGVTIVDDWKPESAGEGQLVVVEHRSALRGLAARLAPESDAVDTPELLNALWADKKVIAVTGTHGRATLASLVAWILECDGQRPGFYVDAVLNNFGESAQKGTSRWVVAEVAPERLGTPGLRADFAAVSFLDDATPLSGQVPERAVQHWLEGQACLKECFVNLDCQTGRTLVASLGMRPTGYSLQHASEFRASLADISRLPVHFEAWHRDRSLGEGLQIGLPGAYNVTNALGAMSVAIRLGIAPEVVAEALRTYRGLRNRLAHATGAGVAIWKDDSREPWDIVRVMQAARHSTSGRVIAVFAPRHDLLQHAKPADVAAAFGEADEVVLTHAGSMHPLGQACYDTLLRAISADARAKGHACPHAPELLSHVLESAHPGDCVVFFGREGLHSIADRALAALVQRGQQTAPAAHQPRMDGPLTQGEEP